MKICCWHDFSLLHRLYCARSLPTNSLWAMAKLVSSDWMAYVIARHHANLITTVSIGRSIN